MISVNLTRAKLGWVDWVRGSSTTAAVGGFWVCSGQCLKAAIKSGPRKDQWWISDKIMGTQGSMMRVVLTDDPLQFKILTRLQMLVVIERCQSTQYITVCCIISFTQHVSFTQVSVYLSFCLTFTLQWMHLGETWLTGAGIKLLTFQLVHELLYLLSQSHPERIIFFLIHRKSK